jgi:uncharacterized protein (TIGR02594 family)
MSKNPLFFDLPLWIKILFILFVLTLFCRACHAQEIPLTVQIAETQIGKGEMYGKDAGPIVEMYTRGKDVSWCAGFVSWVRYQSGLRDYYYLSARSYWAHRSNRVKGTPREGDIIVFSRGTHQGHVGIIEKVQGERITTIEGNVGKFPAKVRRFHYRLGHIKHLLGFVRI